MHSRVRLPRTFEPRGRGQRLRDARRELADNDGSRSVPPGPSKASSRHLRALHRLPRVVPPKQRRRPHEHHAVRVLLLRKVAQYPSTTLCVRTTPRTPQLGHHPPDRFSPARRRRRAAPPTARHRGAGHQLQRSRAGSARTPRSPPRTRPPPTRSSRCVRGPLQHHTKPNLVCRFQPDNERNRTSTHCVGTNRRNMSQVRN